jgi:hypothetical protein
MPSIRAAQGRKTDFTLLSNTAARDKRLSGLALGIIYKALSYPPDWEFTIDWLVAELPSDSRASISAAVKELERLGYVGRLKTSGGRGVWNWTNWISDEPLPADKRTPVKGNKGGPKKPHAKALEAASTSSGVTSDESTSHENTCYVNHEHVTTCGNVVSSQVVTCVQDTCNENREHKKKKGFALKEVELKEVKASQLEAGPVLAGIPDFALPLINAIQARGVIGITWKLGGHWPIVQTLMQQRGVEEMAEHAVIAAAKANADGRRVRTASYFLPGWKDLPPKAPDGTQQPEMRLVGLPAPLTRRQQEQQELQAKRERQMARARARSTGA